MKQCYTSTKVVYLSNTFNVIKKEIFKFTSPKSYNIVHAMLYNNLNQNIDKEINRTQYCESYGKRMIYLRTEIIHRYGQLGVAMGVDGPCIWFAGGV